MTSLKPVLSDIYRRPGPFATVYLDATRSTESGAHEVELRWRSLRETLAGQGAPSAELDAIEAALGADEAPGRHGRALIAAGGEVLLDDVLGDPPAREEARFAPLPHVMPYLAQTAGRVPYLLVLADRTGADLGVPSWAGGGVETVEGDQQFPVHKTGRNDWSELHFQHRVENAWENNAREVAEEVSRRTARSGIRMIVLAGDPRATSLLRTALEEHAGPDTEIVHVEHGARADGASEEALAAAVRDAVLAHVWRQRREVLAHLQQNLGRAEYAVAGVAGVVDALRRAAVDTLVISDDPSSTLHAYIGPEAVQLALEAEEVRALGVDEPARDRLDAALVRAVVGTGGSVLITPNAHEYVADGVAALLRYDERAAG